MDEEQQPFTPQDGPSSGKHSQPTTQLCETSQAEKPSDMAEEQAEGAPEWLGGILHDLLNTEVKTALETVLLPRTRAIEQDVSTMQSQAQSISVKSKEEHAEVENDLAKMAQQVYDFQNQVSQVFGRGWEIAVTGSSEQQAHESEQSDAQ
ncbi:hypothetical protein WJX79_008258 [Trebouxia sp. C0005]